MADTNTVIEGSVKFRDGKKWKSRWCVMRKLSPVADCLHLQLYRDSRDRYKQGQTKASLSLQHFLGFETGFTLDKESNTIAIICQDVTVVLAFDTRERLIQWQVKISCNLGDGQQFLVLVSQAPPKAKIPTGPARMHVQDYRFCMTSGVPPRLIGCWEISQLRRYGVVEGRFCFEGGSRCGKGEGLHVLVTDEGSEITKTFQMASQGKLAPRRKLIIRKASAMESPRKLLHRPDTRASDILASELSTDTFDSESFNNADHRSGSPFWSVESRNNSQVEVDSNYGCGDTVSVHMQADNGWPSDGRRLPASLERCVSCISKLGAPSMSRSSTANTSLLFNPAWTMEPIPSCPHNTNNNNNSDRMSISSHGTGSSGNSEYSVPRHICTSTPAPPVPPKTPPPPPVVKCQCPPTRPPKSAHVVASAVNASSPSRKKAKKPPMPLPEERSCSCAHEYNDPTGPFENYDVPKTLFPPRDLIDKQPQSVSPPCDYYDTPKNIKECLSSSENYGNYDTPPAAKTLRKPCGCIVTFARQAADTEPRAECPCQRVMCWAENWMMLPYCRRGHGVENNSVAIQKVKLSGEGKMPVVNACGELAVYATVDKTKKCKKPVPPLPCEENENKTSNYVNIDTSAHEPPSLSQPTEQANYQNIDFAQSLEYYENSKDVVHRAGINKEELEHIKSDVTDDVSFSTNNGVKFCNKCGHACEPHHDQNDQDRPKQEDYLMMEPNQCTKMQHSVSKNPNFPGYLPMFPSNKTDALKMLANRGLSSEKSASIPSLPNCVQRGRKRADCESRVPGAAMMVMPSLASPFLRRIIDPEEDRRAQLASRKRSSSADSSRYLEDLEESRTSSPCSPLKSNCKQASNSLSSLPYQSPKKIAHEEIPPVLTTTEEPPAPVEPPEEDVCEKTIVEDLGGEGIGEEEEDCSSSGSLQTLVHEVMTDASSTGTVYIRRSSSVPCKSGNNRDSSSSNDSGVSTGSLRHRGGDFSEFELPLTTALSTRRHQSVTQKHSGVTCIHSSLPRRSKSSDPLRELSFQFQMTRIPAKSSSAEAEVPICPAKKGYCSPGDGMTVPYMDSRSTSSGTSDMSDYIETLSLSSHSSSDAQPDIQRINRIPATTLRPRSGNEYHKIDRSILSGEIVKVQRGHYANIAPLPEKSESPSPGYMSSSPAHDDY